MQRYILRFGALVTDTASGTILPSPAP
jgi:hypothetical protein